MVEWECLLTCGGFEELIDSGEPQIVAGQDLGRCVVFAISPRLSAALAEAQPSDLKDLAVSWAAQRAADVEVIDPGIAHAMVCDLAAFVSAARRQGQSVSCRVA